MKAITTIAFFLFLHLCVYAQDDTFHNANTRHKIEGTISVAYSGGFGYYWNLNSKRDVIKSQNNLGLRVESFALDIMMLGLSYDWYKVISRKKISPIFGFQLGVGLAGEIDWFPESEYLNFTPYGGVNFKSADRYDIDVTFQLRYYLIPDIWPTNINPILPSVGAAIRF